MSSIRVAQVMGYMNGGGVEQVVMNYYRHIDRTRVQFDFIVCEGSTLVPREEIEGLGGRVFMVPPYSRLLAFQRALYELFREQGWMIVHSHMNALSVFPLQAAARAGVPVRIAHSHSTAGRGEPLRNLAKAILKTQSNRFSTNRFACSAYAGKWLFGKDGDFQVIPNAIELGRFTFAPSARTAIRRELGFTDDQLVVGHVGRFMAQKNHLFLVEVFSRIVATGADAILVLVGEGELRGRVERRVRELGISDRVLFLGQRDDVGSLYSAFDLFALPSLYEGLGMVVIEAQVNGLPCIVSDQVPKEALISPDCVSLPLSSRQDWIDAIVKLLHNHRRTSVDLSVFSDYDICAKAHYLEEFYRAIVCE